MKKRKIIRQVISCVYHLSPSYLLVIIVTNMLVAVTPFVNIIFSSRILDELVQKRPAEEIMRTAVSFLIISGIVVLLRWGLEHIKVVKAQYIEFALEQSVFDKAHSLDYEVLERKETLDKIYKAREGEHAGGGFTQFCNQLGQMITIVSKMIYATVILTGIIVTKSGSGSGSLYHFMSEWYSIVPVIVILAASIFVSVKMEKRRGKIQKDAFDNNVDANRRFSYLYELLQNYRLGKDIRMYKMADMVEHEMTAAMDSVEAEMESIIGKKIRIMSVSQFGNVIFQVVCNCYVGIKALFGFITVGNVVRYVSSLLEFGNAVGDLLNVYVQLEISSSFLIYYIEFLEIQSQKHEGTLPVEKPENDEYEIEFKNVSFQYPNMETPALSHVNIKLKMGHKMAVVGPNGAGKTTFIKMLCRLYDPTEGEILLNGVNIKEYDYEEYMKIFSVVFQDFKLFDFSLAENVASSVDYDEEKIKRCLKEAGFEKRLEDMPNGIRTNLYQLEDEGVEISGGEAQKIAIARALYKDAPIVILDEPTSALDPVSEYDIYKRFDELVRDKTAIYISHRMSSCRFCDTILVFDGGTIVQNGNHEELTNEKDGIYRQMWDAQAQYYQED